MPTSDLPDESEPPEPVDDHLPTSAGQTAVDRGRLRGSEAAVTSEVIAFQLARRLDPRSPRASGSRESALSPRELEVLALLAAGSSDGDIAERLFISKKTASVHVANIKGKLGAASRVEIALFAAQLGLVDEDTVHATIGRGHDRGGRLVMCPFKGLASFEVADAPYFFGREQLVAQLVARLAGSTFLGVVGPSGSGKSSVVRAGLIPALAAGVLPESERWIAAVLRPGATPSAELQHALSLAVGGAAPALDGTPVTRGLDALPPRSRLLLVVDQFEELFTVCRSTADRARFVRSIVELARDPSHRAIVVIAVRADFYGRCADDRDLAELVGANQVLIGPMTADEIARAVQLPAGAAGLRIEPELTTALVSGVINEPGGLPVLSTTLLELWQRREGRTMRLADYQQIGGLSGAVSRLAEAAFERLTPTQQAIARAVFLRLAMPGEGGSIVRRPAELTDFDVDSDSDVEQVLAVLTDSRLLTANDGSIEVAHEVLLHDWPRLRGWLDEDAEGRRVREHLVRVAAEWERGGRDRAELYRGARLAAAQDWASGHDVELNATERTFLAESKAAGERESDRQRRTNRRLAGLLSGVAILLVVTLAAAGLAVAQLGRAGEQARLAQARELYASAIAALDEDPQLSILLTIEAARLEPPTAASITSLHQAVQASRALLDVQLPDAPVQPTGLGVALSPDGRTLYASGDSASVQVWDVETHALVRTLGTPRPAAASQPANLALSGDGTHVAIIDDAAVIHVWATSDGSERQLTAPGAGVGWPVFSPDGRRLAALTAAGVDPEAGLVLSVWDVDRASLVGSWHRRDWGTIVFRPGGDQLLVTSCVCDPEETLDLLDLKTGEESTAIGSVQGILDSRPSAAQISRDATRLATVGRDGAISLWDTDDGALIRRFGRLRGITSDVAFSPSGTRLATTSNDEMTRVWDLASGELERTLVGQRGTITSAWFSADGSRIATGSSTLGARVWDLSNARAGEVAGIDLGAEFGQIIDVDHQGSVVAVLGRPCALLCLGEVAVVDLASGQRMVIDQQGGAAVAVAPDGSGVISQAGSLAGGRFATGPIRKYRLWSGEPAYELEGICPLAVPGGEGCGEAPDVPWDDQAADFAFSPDGSILAMRGSGSSLATWRAATGDLLNVTADLTTAGPAFDPDGSRIAASRGGADVAVLDPSTLHATSTVLELGGIERLQFSPDGSRLVAVSAAFDTRIHDAGSWELGRELPVQSHDLDFDSTGQTLATADTDGSIRLWDVRAGDELQAIPIDRTGIGFRLDRVAFLDDERHLLTVDANSILVMTSDVDELIEIARSRLTRGLTAAECLKYLGEACPTS